MEIAVHCDIGVFEWLISYMNGDDPVIAPNNVVTILISGDFLGMDKLVEMCLHYMKN